MIFSIMKYQFLQQHLTLKDFQARGPSSATETYPGLAAKTDGILLTADEQVIPTVSGFLHDISKEGVPIVYH
jgi:hypothetical protein